MEPRAVSGRTTTRTVAGLPIADAARLGAFPTVLGRCTGAVRRVAVPAGLFGASRLVLWALAAVVPLSPRQAGLGRLGRLVDVADAAWYLRIALGGYAHVPLATALGAHRAEDWVFFPLFPLSARAVADLLGTPVLWTGVAIANACFLAFAVVLHRWVARDHGSRAATTATALACFCPLSPYFTGFRAASMFLLASTACLERLSRRKPGQAGIAGALASLARPDGLLLLVPFMVTALLWLGERRSRHRGAMALCASPLLLSGAGVMAWICARDAGTALAFMREQAVWGRALRPPFAAFAPFFAHPYVETGFRWTSAPVALCATVLGLLAVVWLVRWRARAATWAYLLATVIGATASTVLLGLPRFVAEAPPLYLAGALAGRRTGRVLVAASVVLMAVYSTYWLLGAPWTMA